MLDKKKNLETIFKIVYIIHLLLAFNGLVNQTFIIKITLALTLTLGAIVGIQKVLDYKKFTKRKNFWLLNAFIVSYIISMVMNFKYGVIDNLQGLAWLSVEIWILYMVDEKNNIKKEFILLSKIYIGCVSVANIVSIGMYLIGYSGKILVEGRMRFLGFHWGRLWGIYNDPNHGAIIASLAVVLALYFVVLHVKNVWIYWGSIAIQSSYIILSDSRTGILCLGIGAGLVYSFFYLSRYRTKVSIWNICISLCILILFIGGISAVKSPLQTGFGRVGSVTVKMIQFNESGSTDEENEDEEISVGRKEEMSDPSNRRFDIWKSGVEIFLTKPITGIGWQNIVAYADEEVPNTYLVNNDLQKFASCHNMPIDVLVGQGIIGITILVLIIVRSLCLGVKSYKNVADEDVAFMIILFSVLVISLFASLLISSIFYINSPESYMFWMCFGYLIVLLEKGICKEVE